jgi:ubiquitin carboxyl-terminal hydrolase 5/13
MQPATPKCATSIFLNSDSLIVLIQVKLLVDGIMQSMSSSRQSEVKAWEEEINPCEHTLLLQQDPTGHVPGTKCLLNLERSNSSVGQYHCSSCDLTENLWLCLTCGSLGCGRQQFGGAGGNGHGIAHFDSTGHPVSLKLGTITPEGNGGAVTAFFVWRGY